VKRYRPNVPAVVTPGRKPAGWKLELEVLATLPPASPAPLETLAADFRLSLNEIRRVVRCLARDFGIIQERIDGHDRVYVPRRQWDTIAEVVERYWAVVWEPREPLNLN
jgi:hypothetical protein